MSRCFPFPPPGYESKARPNDLNLIVKEDKHKKHKKDKDKKERSKRKDKERAEGKHKEDKDRKQKKHKDKKDKKEKRKSSEENKVVGPSSENQNGEKPNGWHDNGNPGEFGKKVGNGDGAMDEKRSFLEEKKIVNHPEIRNRGELGPGNISGNGAHGLVGMGKEISTNEKKIVGLHSENLIGERPGSYNDDSGDGGRNHMKEKHKPFEDKNIAGPSEIRNSENAGVYNKSGYGAHENRALFEMAGRVRADDGTTYNSYPIVSGHNLRVDAQCSGNTWVGNFSGEKQTMVENSPCQANSVEKKKEGKEKTKLGNSVGEGDEHKNRDKKKEDKKRKREDEVKIEERKIKQRASDGNLLDMCANKPVDLLKEGWDKQPELKEQFTLNGFLHGNGTQPDNTSRAAISSRQVDQNRNGVQGHKNTIIPLAADKQQALITKQMVNGSKLPSPQSVIKNVWDQEPCPTANNSSPEPPRACVKNHSREQNGRRKDKKELGVSGVLKGNKVIPPYPDLKYLSEILTVSKIEPPPFSDNDEEWLFGCNKDAKKAKFGSSSVGFTERVWANAVRLEAADVVAMPRSAAILDAGEEGFCRGCSAIWMEVALQF